jgi:hypothetical protein
VAAICVASARAADIASFDGYAFGMTVIQAESVAPARKTFECGRLMTSRCIVYKRQLGTLSGTVAIEFSLDERRIERVEIVPRVDAGKASCDAAWTGLVGFLTSTYGTPETNEGNTRNWRAGPLAVTATVVQGDDDFCDVAAALTLARD